MVSNDNPRYKEFLCVGGKDAHEKAYKAARSVLNSDQDYVNGGCFWDGVDLKMKKTEHYRYKAGFRFSDPTHNIFGIEEPPPKNQKKPFGVYDYAYESTAAQGSTVFWKYTKEYIKSTRATQCI